MDLFSNNIYNFIYIAVIILGGVTLTLTIILRAKERDRQHGAICLFVGSIFIYMILDFITYYYLGEKVSGDVVFALITTSDIFFCVLVSTWVYAILVLMDLDNVISMKIVAVVTAVYLIASQFLSIDLGRYDTYALHVESGIGKMMLQVINAGYCVFIIAIGLRCLMFLLKKYKKSGAMYVNVLMIMSLILYMVWVAYWDYSTWYKTEEKLIDIYAMDPLILLYAIFNGVLIYYFYKKDPLCISESHIAPDDAVYIIAERYNLSDREKDVLIEINKGKTNKQIASDLSITENTVKRHVNNIFKKTETQGRHEIMSKIANMSSAGIKFNK